MCGMCEKNSGISLNSLVEELEKVAMEEHLIASLVDAIRLDGMRTMAVLSRAMDRAGYKPLLAYDTDSGQVAFGFARPDDEELAEVAVMALMTLAELSDQVEKFKSQS